MYNYYNLNDVEFEILCKDIMEKMLSLKLRVFSKGRDGGIDLTDDVTTYNVIVQAKHYIGSSFSNLRISMKSEIEKVVKWNPNQYYVCCGMQLTASNVREIYGMFSKYMESDKNILTLKEIDDFLQMPENIDIVRKHYKLWLYASNILNEFYNQNIFVDCEVLLSELEEEAKYFVQTNIYSDCLNCLEKHRIIMITGSPGVGKTMTSKMLVLYYASQGYKVRYATNGVIANIKNSLSSDRECKELVLLDDCLGQCYFNMLDTQENELISLVKYIKMFPNKKIILNSRVTIFNEAKERSEEFNLFVVEKKVNQYTINMDNISVLEKARIFYNHLVFKRIPKEYYESIKNNKNYLRIVNHTNYTPRIIEHVTCQANYLEHSPAEYYSYIMNSLNNPQDVWKNEFNIRLRNVDRAFLSTLYSLTDTNASRHVMKMCFDHRLLQMDNIDYTLNNFELTLSRLNQSIVKVVDNRGVMHIGVINPSVNDYIKTIFNDNALELAEVRKSIIHFDQLQRCYTDYELPDIIQKRMLDGTMSDIVFTHKHHRESFIGLHICKYKIMHISFTPIVHSYITSSYGYYCSYFTKKPISHIDILEYFLEEPAYSFYSIDEVIFEYSNINNLLENLEIDDLVPTIEVLSRFYQDNNTIPNWFYKLCADHLTEGIENHIDSIEVSDFCVDYDIQSLISQNMEHWSGDDDYGAEVDVEAVVRDIENQMCDDIQDGINDKLSGIDQSICKLVKRPSTISVDTNAIETMVNSYFEPDVMDDDYSHRDTGAGNHYSDEIEAIFER